MAHCLEAEYASLRKHQIFGEFSTQLTEPPIDYKLIFFWKFDEHGNLIRFKVRLVAQRFSQRLGIDFDQKYSPILYIISFRYLLALAIHFSLGTFL